MADQNLMLGALGLCRKACLRHGVARMGWRRLPADAGECLVNLLKNKNYDR